MSEFFQTVPVSTILFGLIAVGTAAFCLAIAVPRALRWKATTGDLQELMEEMGRCPYATKKHRSLYANAAGVMAEIRERSGGHPGAREVVDEIWPRVDMHRRAGVLGGTSEWDEISDWFLQRHYRTIRLLRAAAGWVVLMGLAGTVLGFLEALPLLKNELDAGTLRGAASSVKLSEPGAEPAGDDPPATASSDTSIDRAALTASILAKLFGSLGGVFVATFCGVISALFLYIGGTGYVEPAFEDFAAGLEAFGRRWYVPLLQAPDTLVDESLRSELRTYFDEIGKRFDDSLSPVIKKLERGLERMTVLSTQFSTNIQAGRDTITTFQTAVSGLGKAAESTVGNMERVAGTLQSFLQQVQALQQQGGRQIAEAVGPPSRLIAQSAANLDTQISGLGPFLEQARQDGKAFRDLVLEQAGEMNDQLELVAASSKSANQAISDQTQRLAAISAGLLGIGPNIATALSERLTKVFDELPQRLLDGIEVATPALESPAPAQALGLAPAPTGVSRRQERLLQEQVNALRSIQQQLGKMAAPRPSVGRRLGHRLSATSESFADWVRGLFGKRRPRAYEGRAASEGRRTRSKRSAIPPSLVPTDLRSDRESEPRQAVAASANERSPRTEAAPDLEVPAGLKVAKATPLSNIEVPTGPATATPPASETGASSRGESEAELKRLARNLRPWVRKLSLSNRDLVPIVGEMSRETGADVEQLRLAGPSSDDWEVMILRPRSWSRGLAIARPGVQVDTEAVRLFDAEFGMRVKSCLEPAIVQIENEKNYDVLQKGKVKTE